MVHNLGRWTGRIDLGEQHDEWAEGRLYLTFTDDTATETLPSSNILEAAA